MIIQNKKGCSLLEILIYTGLIAMVGTLLSGILISVTQLGNQQSASSEVNQQLNFVLQTVQRLVRDSSLVDIPSGTATSSLVLRMKIPSEDPTKIYLSGNKIYLQQGTGGTPSPLIDDQILANNITFVKISAYPGHDSVQVDLTLSYNTQNPQESFTKSLSSAVARVSAATFDSDAIPGTTNNYDIGSSVTRWKNLYLSGNLISSGAGNNSFAGNVGIGTTNPNFNLEVQGTASSTSLYAGKIGTDELDMNNGKIVNLLTPTASSDAATKGYVDAASGGKTQSMQTFTASAGWTRPVGVNMVWVSLVGGGGGGGGGGNDGNYNSGGGGGAGQSFYRYPCSVSGNVAVTVGGAGGAGSSCGIGGNGGGSSFGDCIIATGGFGGGSCGAPSGGNSGGGVAGGGYGSSSGSMGLSSASNALGSTGGAGGGGIMNNSGTGSNGGNGGGDGAYVGGKGGVCPVPQPYGIGGGGGGSSGFGKGGIGGYCYDTPGPKTAATSGSGYGSGGGGGGYSAAAAAGTAGLVIVEWWQ